MGKNKLRFSSLLLSFSKQHAQ